MLPALIYLKLKDGQIFSKEKLPALGLLIFGVLVAVLGVLFLILDFDQVDTCSHGKVMKYCENTTLTYVYESYRNVTMAPSLSNIARI